MKRAILAVLMSLLFAIISLPLQGQEGGGSEEMEFCSGLIAAARNYCNQSYYTCRVGRGTCPVACGYGTDPVCDDQYDYCMDSVVPWYCGPWAN